MTNPPAEHPLVVDSIVNAFRVIEWMAQDGYREVTARQVEDAVGLSPAQVRGLLLSAQAAGWVRGIPDPGGKTIARWTLDAKLPHLAELYRVALTTKLQTLLDQAAAFQRPGPPTP